MTASFSCLILCSGFIGWPRLLFVVTHVQIRGKGFGAIKLLLYVSYLCLNCSKFIFKILCFIFDPFVHTYFIRDHSDAPQKYSDADVIKMLEYLIDNIFVEFGGRIFQQTIGIPMGTNCAPLLADLFLYSYEAEFVQSLLQAGKKHLAQQFSFTYRYIDDVLSLKNTKFAEYLEFIYPRELEIKETTETSASSSYLDCYLYIDNGKLTTRLYDKRDDFNFPIVNFPFLSSNIPSAPAYGVYVSQLIRYARTCSNYQDFMERGKVLTQKLLSQGYQKTKLVATLKKFYGRHHDLVNPYNVAVSRIVSDVFASDAP